MKKNLEIRKKSEEIINLYKDKLMNLKEISNLFGCSIGPIYSILKENNIIMTLSERRKILAKAGKLKIWSKGLTKETDERLKLSGEKSSIKNKGISKNKRIDVWNKSNEIIRLYRDELMSVEEIGKLFECSIGPICSILKEKNIRMSSSERLKKLYKEGKIKDWCEGLTKETDERIKKISEKNIGHRVSEEHKKVLRERMTGRISPKKKNLDEKEIIKLYRDELINPREIGIMFNCHYSLIYRILKKNNVSLIPFVHTRETKIKMSAKQQGITIEQWKGYITPLNHQIRTSSEYQNWIKAVFQNNNFTCLGCGQRGGNLEAHHIIPFKEIMLENNIKTFDEALTCKILWNIRNGMTLCPNCHVQVDKHRYIQKQNSLQFDVPIIKNNGEKLRCQKNLY